MQGRIFFIILILFLTSDHISAQKENYLVVKAPFSQPGSDEFSPVYYKSGIVFCSNSNSGLFSGYSTKGNKPFFKLFYADTSRSSSETRTIQGDVNTHFNNGPATFSRNGDTMYFSRNLVVQGAYHDIASEKNKLGLFSAVLRNGKWTDVKELRFNDNSWNVTTPFLSPDGKTLYFASDKPDGYGGSDLYKSEWMNGYWGNAVNLGSIVNSGGNEAYPFIDKEGNLFFSSDGHKGRGGKDIFFTRFVDTSWITPVDLNPPVNSTANDFGFIADNTISKGYFSSDRGKMLDIYSFKTIYPQFLYCYPETDNNYCISLSDDAMIDIDPIAMKFQWNFGNSERPAGYVVKHCFPGPGKYTVSEDIADKKTGRTIINKLRLEVEIHESTLPQINTSEKIVSGTEIKFKPVAPAGFDMLSQYWDFGDSENGSGSDVSHSYTSYGNYEVKMLSKLKDRQTGELRQVCVSKIISISAGGQATPQPSGNKDEGLHFPENISVKQLYSASEEVARRAVFVVEILRSEKKLDDNDPLLRNISSKYIVRRVMLPGEKTWSYLIAEELAFMSAYPALSEALSSGYNNARIRTYMPSDTAQVDLWNFKRTYGTSSSDYFVNNGTIISQHGITILDRMVLLLRRNPRLNIIIVAHTDSSAGDAVQLTGRQAQSIADYLVNRGIDKQRLSVRGYGSSQPVAPEYPESVRMKNRRVDFIASGAQ